VQTSNYSTHVARACTDGAEHGKAEASAGPATGEGGGAVYSDDVQSDDVQSDNVQDNGVQRIAVSPLDALRPRPRRYPHGGSETTTPRRSSWTPIEPLRIPLLKHHRRGKADYRRHGSP
jgi:hypothetical protein